MSHDMEFWVGFEDTFISQSERGERPLDEYELTRHYAHWSDDLERAAATGARRVRWGIPWHRINPSPGRWEFSWVDAVIDRFAALGLDPVIDLMHYGTPGWLAHEFLHPDYPERVAEYAARVAERYRGLFGLYSPLNEPLLNALYCGRYGYWPPYAEGDEGFVRVLGAIARGIVLTQEAVTSTVGDDVRAIHVEAGMRFEGAPEVAEDLRFLRGQALLPEDLVCGMVDENHPLASFLLRYGLSEEDLAWFRAHATPPTLMGVNYYPLASTELIEPAGPQGDPLSPRPHVNAGAMGLVDVLSTFAKRYGRPIVLTETCSPGSYEDRIRWLDTSLATVRSLRSNGTDIRGYTWWSVIDMIEWDYRDSDKPLEDHLLRMGLWDLATRPDGDLIRLKNPVAARFREYATGRR